MEGERGSEFDSQRVRQHGGFMLVCGIDFEATSDQPTEARITEIGAVLFEAEGGKWTPKETFSRLVWDNSYPKQSDVVIRVTGITDEMLSAQGVVPQTAFGELIQFAGRAQMVIAHNKKFDEALHRAEFLRVDPRHLPLVPPDKWLCSYRDVPYPDYYRCKQLSHLALDHGIPVDPGLLHRAVGDVELMGKLLEKGGYSLDAILAYRSTPWVYLQALVEKPWEDGGKSTALAKERGYSWQQCYGKQGPVFEKMWVKRVKADKLAAEKATESPFMRKVLCQGPHEEQVEETDVP